MGDEKEFSSDVEFTTAAPDDELETQNLDDDEDELTEAPA